MSEGKLLHPQKTSTLHHPATTSAIPGSPHPPAPPLPPLQALLFDEDYTDHDFYQFEKFGEWLESAELVVFVGTSFAVTLTSLAVDEARDRKIPIFDVNVTVDEERASKPTLKWNAIEGPAELKLPELVKLVNPDLVFHSKPP